MKKIVRKNGFTLGELLIVTAIIGILAAVSIPVFAAQLEKSRRARCLANMRGIYADVAAALLSEGEDAANAKAQEQIAKIKCDGVVYSCTLGDDDQINLFCPKHGFLRAGTLSPGSMTSNLKLALNAIARTGSGLIYQGGAAGDRAEAEMARFGMTIQPGYSWQYWRQPGTSAMNGQILLIDTDIQQLPKGSPYYAMLYDGIKGTYAYRIGTVDTKTENGKTINYLSTTSNSANFKTAAEAIKAIKNDSRVLTMNSNPFEGY